MLTQTNYTISVDKVQEAITQIPTDDFRFTINQPTGDFFYDKWKLKDEFKGTIWEELYNSLPVHKGEARIINLDPASCYQIHSDIDDRYHLNLTGEACYLIDFDYNSLHKLSADGIWYEMDAGRLHSAGNFGRSVRAQLVIRKLLLANELSDPVTITLTSTITSKDDTRFMFDQNISNWLNCANKKMIINNFKVSQSSVSFNLERAYLTELQHVLINGFSMEVK